MSPQQRQRLSALPRVELEALAFAAMVQAAGIAADYGPNRFFVALVSGFAGGVMLTALGFVAGALIA
jgi:hypothetical protein